MAMTKARNVVSYRLAKRIHAKLNSVRAAAHIDFGFSLGTRIFSSHSGAAQGTDMDSVCTTASWRCGFIDWLHNVGLNFYLPVMQNRSSSPIAG
jgi:hypothetical protein